ncbi:hypothetical protein [Streptomyces lavendulae]|uniref:hypothetical protein n=1 Tax=Streptomyces lavendulae TaxID=1914 RepID=UPI0036E84D42
MEQQDRGRAGRARVQLEAVFTADFAAQPEGRRALLLAGLETTTSWEAWQHLRFTRNPEEARQVMA